MALKCLIFKQKNLGRFGLYKSLIISKFVLYICKMKEDMEKETSKELNQDEKINLDLNTLDLDTLIVEIEKLSSTQNPYSVSKEIENIKSIFYKRITSKEYHEELNELDEETSPNNSTLHPLEVKFKKAFRNYQKIKSNYRKEKEKVENKNLQIKSQIIKDIDLLTQEEESMKKTFEQFRNLQNKWRNTGYVPANRATDLWHSYHHHVELFYDYIKLNKDLRDLDFKRNLEEKELICKKAEDLLKEESLNKMHSQLQELHEHWRNIGPVQKKLREDLWIRFQEISKALNKKRNDYFLSKKNKEKKILIEKNKLCEKIEGLTKSVISSHNEWKNLTIKCNDLEKEWKNLGRLNKENNKIAWKGFRDALNNFYKKRNLFYKNKRTDENQIIDKKLSICKEAETLQDSTDWDITTKKIINLQKKWKSSGYSSRDKTNKIWIRFKKSCDIFFKNKKIHSKKTEELKRENLKAKKMLIKELESFNISSNKSKDIKEITRFCNIWKEIGKTPVEEEKKNTIFLSLLESKYKEIGLNEDELKEALFKNKIILLKGDQKSINAEKTYLKNKIDIISKDIAKYENNISFLSNSKNTKPLVEQTLEKIKESNNEKEDLQQKLQILNQG